MEMGLMHNEDLIISELSQELPQVSRLSDLEIVGLIKERKKNIRWKYRAECKTEG